MEHTQQRLLITIDEAARMLSLRASTVRRLVSTGVIPCVRLGKKTVLISPTAVEEWITQQARNGSPSWRKKA